MASRRANFQLFILILLCLLTKINILEAISCSQKERNALLTFKEGLNDTSNCLSSWIGENCCNWSGVGCSNQTGHVTKLDLHSQYFLSSEEEDNNTSVPCKQLRLGGKLNPSLLDLKYLNYLDLSGNNFQGTPIPNFVGSLMNLRHLDLSHSSFSGMVPANVGNLSKLRHLDLNTFSYPPTLWVSDLNWLPNLSSLQYLDLGGINLSAAATYWLQAVNMLPTLLELHLDICKLPRFPQFLPFINFTSLQVLRLGGNDFNSPIPPWVFNISTLKELELDYSKIKGNIPEVARGNLCSLRIVGLSNNDITGDIEKFMEALSECSNSSLWWLDLNTNKLEGNLPNSLGSFQYLVYLILNENSLSGRIPTSIGNLSSLAVLDLSFNKLHGSIPDSVGQLTSLHELSLWGNSWEGIISEIHLQNLTLLSKFSISSFNNSLVFNIKHGWVPTFSLSSVEIDDCLLGPTLPPWIRTQTGLDTMTLKSSGISGRIPYWLWKLSSLRWLDLSNNQLSGELPNSIYFPVEASVLLGLNRLKGSLPIWPNVTSLSLRNNLFSGSIPSNIGQKMSRLRNLDLSGNFLNGSIPTSIREMRNLSSLDLSHNYLSGELLKQWKGLEELWILDLSNNNLSGGIPSSVCSQLPLLYWLKLGGNKLSGELPFQNCTGLAALDLRDNRFSGTIPTLINVEDLSSLQYLSLRSNMLNGNIPEQLCHLPVLHVVDLAHNNLSGPIPVCLGSLVQLKYPGFYFQLPPLKQQRLLITDFELVVKGRLTEYKNIISLLNLIDLSSNNLSGEIPEEMTNLSRLGTLNLSRNHLMGRIPENIGNLQLLESLDLSWNHLSGPIPPSMSSLTSLSYLNLSYNNFSGKIPSANQFQTLDSPWIYEGNPDLCGPPSPTNCSSPSNSGNSKDTSNRDQNADKDDDHETLWFYISLASGYVVGFCAVCGTLLMNKSLRHAYFKFADDMKEKLMVFIAINKARLQRKLNRSAN